MNDDFIRALRREEAKLRSELEGLSLYRRLMAISATISEYEDPAAPAVVAQVEGTKPTAVPRQHTATIKPGTKTARINEAVVAYLRNKGARAMSGELLDVVTGKGIEIGGKVPTATIASYLSNSPFLDNVQGQGYGLKEWARKQETSPDGHPKEVSESSEGDASLESAGKSDDGLFG